MALLFRIQILVLFFYFPLKSQLSGTYTIPGTYSTIAAAISALNTQGVNGTVTILVSAGYAEFAPVGGYSLYATGTSTSPIFFQKNGSGANPLITAYTGGSGTPSSAIQDGIWKFFGCDYVTVDGISLTDPNTSNNSTMEFGFGFFKSSAANGCQNNTIKNCIITLNKINNAAGAGVASEGSRGIDLVNAFVSTHTTAVTVTASAGSHSYNHFYNNLIQNCNLGIALIGFVGSSPFSFSDFGNDIGGNSAATSNTIINYGGGSSAQSAYGIKTLAQYNFNASYNYMNNNTGSNNNHSGGLYGILSGTATSANVTINSNTISLKGAGTSFLNYGIINFAGANPSSNTITINGNLITDCSYTSAVNGAFQGIVNNGADPSILNITYNTIRNGTCSASSNGYICISNGGNSPNINIIGNEAYNMNFIGTNNPYPPFYFIYNIGGASNGTITVSSNSVSNVNMTPGVPSPFYGIRIWGNQSSTLSVISNNVFGSMNNVSNGSMYLISHTDDTPNTLVAGNTTTGSINMSGGGGTVYCYQRTGILSAGSSTISNNNFSNINANNHAFYGIYNTTSSLQNNSISSNTIQNISTGTTQITGILNGSISALSMNNNFISNLSNSASIVGIITNSAITNSLSIRSNTLGLFNSAGSNSVYGLYQGSNTNAEIHANKLFDMNGSNSASEVFGIYIQAGINSNLSNNIIGNLSSNASHSNAVNGIYINGGTTNNLFYNTIRINASSTGTLFGSSALYWSGNGGLNLRNNILLNLSVPAGTALTVAFREGITGTSAYSLTSNTNLFYAGTPSANALIYSDGTNAFQTLSAFQSFASPRESLSLTENTAFLSTVGTASNFLHIDPNGLSLAESHALTIPSYTLDFDTDIRQGNAGYNGTGLLPDIGADEFEAIFSNCSSAASPTISAFSASICAGESATLISNFEIPNPGLTRQWYVSNSLTGPFTAITGANGITFTSGTLTSGTYYYQYISTCTLSSNSSTSNIVPVLVSSFPSVSVTPASATLCTGGSPINLSASGAVTYSWSPALGLSSGTLATVSASPAITTTYVVTGSNPGNCSGTNSIVILRLPSAGGITVTPSSTITCEGYNLNFQAQSTNTAYAVSAITFSPAVSTTNTVTYLCNNGTILTWPNVGGLDDGAWNGFSIPFTFKLFDVVYSTFVIHTNGHITLGPTAPNTLSGYSLALPTPSAGAPCIGALYADLDFSYVGSISTFTSGVSPNRKVVINWTGGRFFNTSTGFGNVTTQAILYETTNNIEVHTTVSTGGLFAAEGIQNASGTEASTVPGRNHAYFSISNDAYRWSFIKNILWQPGTYLNSNTSFTPTAQNIQSGVVYTVSSTTGNGCTVSTTASFSVIPSPTIIISPTIAPVCAGTTISLSAIGANTFTWNTGTQNDTLVAAPVITTTYIASGNGTVNSCVGFASKVVTVIPLPSLTITGSPNLCKGQIETFSVSGANTYSWSNGNTNPSFTLSATTNTVYSVTGTNTLTTCSSNTMLNVSVYPNPTVSISGTSVICAGKNATLTGSGANTYVWSNFSAGNSIYPNPVSTTVYSVTGFMNPINCSNTAVFTVNVNASPSISILAVPSNTICEGETVQLIAQTNIADTYLWSDGSAASTTSVIPLATGFYSVMVSVASTGCSADTYIKITVDLCEHIEANTQFETLVFPNPTDNKLFIENVQPSGINFELYDLQGRIVLKDSFFPSNKYIELSNLSNGIYFLKLIGSENRIYKVIKQ